MDEPISEFAQLLKTNPGGFSVAPDGTITPDRGAIEVKSLSEFSELARAPKTIDLDLHGGKVVRIKIRPLDCNEQKELDNMEKERPMPPKKSKTPSPSMARQRTESSVVEEYDWDDKKYNVDIVNYLELKRTALIVRGLLGIEIAGDNLEAKRETLQKSFTPRVLDGIANAIKAITSDPIDRALFT